jgi:hypothetical protein
MSVGQVVIATEIDSEVLAALTLKINRAENLAEEEKEELLDFLLEKIYGGELAQEGLLNNLDEMIANYDGETFEYLKLSIAATSRGLDMEEIKGLMNGLDEDNAEELAGILNEAFEKGLDAEIIMGMLQESQGIRNLEQLRERAENAIEEQERLREAQEEEELDEDNEQGKEEREQEQNRNYEDEDQDDKDEDVNNGQGEEEREQEQNRNYEDEDQDDKDEDVNNGQGEEEREQEQDRNNDDEDQGNKKEDQNGDDNADEGEDQKLDDEEHQIEEDD